MGATTTLVAVHPPTASFHRPARDDAGHGFCAAVENLKDFTGEYDFERFHQRPELSGADLGLMSHESSVTAPGDWGELSADVVYLAPSIRWSWLKPRRVRMNVETGVGLYRAEIHEFIEFGYDFVEGTEHYDRWAPGGFVGVSLDVPVGRTGRWSINTGARVHFVDFGDVSAYGTDLGSLDGPITTLQLGLTWDRGG